MKIKLSLVTTSILGFVILGCGSSSPTTSKVDSESPKKEGIQDEVDISDFGDEEMIDTTDDLSSASRVEFNANDFDNMSDEEASDYVRQLVQQEIQDNVPGLDSKEKLSAWIDKRPEVQDLLVLNAFSLMEDLFDNLERPMDQAVNGEYDPLTESQYDFVDAIILVFVMRFHELADEIITAGTISPENQHELDRVKNITQKMKRLVADEHIIRGAFALHSLALRRIENNESASFAYMSAHIELAKELQELEAMEEPSGWEVEVASQLRDSLEGLERTAKYRGVLKRTGRVCTGPGSSSSAVKIRVELSIKLTPDYAKLEVIQAADVDTISPHLVESILDSATSELEFTGTTYSNGHDHNFEPGTAPSYIGVVKYSLNAKFSAEALEDLNFSIRHQITPSFRCIEKYRLQNARLTN